uniref:Uncharacterized protein n=1 Tax=Aegilops tauschii TaxID=37682 RepID=M8BMU1_AEGTA
MNDIHLQKLMPFKSPARLIGSTEDTNVVFVTSDDHGIFTIELKSLLTRKVCEMGKVKDFFPYVCYYTPAVYFSLILVIKDVIRKKFQKVSRGSSILYAVHGACDVLQKETGSVCVMPW